MRRPSMCATCTLRALTSYYNGAGRQAPHCTVGKAYVRMNIKQGGPLERRGSPMPAYKQVCCLLLLWQGDKCVCNLEYLYII